MIEIEPDGEAVRIEMPHGEVATIEGLSPKVVACGTQRALFIDPGEADTLTKMISYILEKVPIRPESQEALRAVRPRLEALFRE